MTPQEENEAIAAWAGLECRCVYALNTDTGKVSTYYFNCPRHSNGGLPPDYDRNEVAINLLNIFAAKGYYPDLDWKVGWQFQIWNRVKVGVTHYKYEFVCESTQPTIAAAIKNAIKLLLEHKPS